MLAPNVTLALEVLRMPLLELQTFLEQQCEENPLLEIEESQNDEAAASAEEPQTNGTEEAPTNGLDEDWMSHRQLAGELEDPTNEDERRERMMDQRLVTPQSLHESLQIAKSVNIPFLFGEGTGGRSRTFFRQNHDFKRRGDRNRMRALGLLP